MSNYLESMDTLTSLALLSACAVAIKLFYAYFSLPQNNIHKYPLVNGRKWWSLFITEQKNKFVTDARGLIDDGLKNVSHPSFCKTRHKTMSL